MPCLFSIAAMLKKLHFFRRFNGLTFVHKIKQKRQMKRATKRVIVISESVNGYGFRVLTDGIDLTQFEKNPLMLWMHLRAFNGVLALGNVIELKREDHPELGKIITGLPVFDDTDEFAMRIYEKYENGTYRMASAGLIPIDWSEEPEYLVTGQRGATLVKSKMQEISLCDIGGDDNALQVALYNDAAELIELSLNGENPSIPLITNPLINNEMKIIQLSAEKAAVLLGLKDTDSPAVYEAKIAEVVQLAQTQKTEIEKLAQEKADEEAKVIKLTSDLEAAKKAETDNKIETMVQLAVDARKITPDEKAAYVALAAKDFESVKTILDAKAGAATVQETISKSVKLSAESLAGKTWSDLDKAGKLVQLKAENRPLFEQLFEAEFKKKYEEVK